MSTAETAKDAPLWALPDTVRLAPDGSPRLMGGRCADCGKLVFPRPPICSHCLSERQEAAELAHEGVLYSYSVVHAARPGWPAPYVIGYVDLAENVRVCAPISCDPAAPPAPDTRMRLEIGRLRTDEKGREVLSHRFTAIDQGDA